MQKVLLKIGMLALAGIVVTAGQAAAQAIITNGSGIYLGVDSRGQLNVPDGTGGISLTPVNSGHIGLYNEATDADATSPGCLCEGWGVAANGVAGWANNASGTSNITLDSFMSTPSTATSVTHLTSLAGISVTHAFQPSSDSRLMEAIVTIANTTGATATDVRYDRTMDWDIHPTTFSEYVSLQGWPATALLHTSNDGFATPNPLVFGGSIGCGAPVNANFTDSGVCDHGARFVFGFGDILDGASRSFSIFYGAAPTELSALSALGAVEAEVYSFGQPSSTGGRDPGIPATYIFGFKGVGGRPVPPDSVPEPGVLALTSLALGAGLFRRHRNKAS